jgi:Class III signal peptide.
MPSTKTRLKPILSFIATRIPAMFSGERAQTTAEYGLIFALVLVTAVVTMSALGAPVQTLWNSFITAWPS